MVPVVTIIAGPTASGKSGYALELAQRVNGTIINADSLQIYDALPLLTAQPSAEDLQTVPHALYGVLPITGQSSAAIWATMAVDAIDEAMAQGRTPIVTGGTGLYLRALMHGLSAIPAVPDAVRFAARQAHQQLGGSEFYAQLQARDPIMAARLHPGDSQRVIRAWEIMEATGQSLAHWQAQPAVPLRPQWQYDVTLILPPREVLYNRCNLRFDQMLDMGVVEEVEVYAGARDAPCTKALGFAPLSAYLQGEITLASAIEQAKQDTRHYAKRQGTWFRGQLQETDKIKVRVIAG